MQDRPGTRMKLLYVAIGIATLLALAIPAAFFYYGQVANPRAVAELMEEPTGLRAQKVMLLTLPSGRRLPVNYLAEDNRIYAGADGRWWKELAGGTFDVTVWVLGETRAGRAKVVEDDPNYTKDIFSRLRPSALPGTGRLIEILLAPADPGGPIR